MTIENDDNRNLRIFEEDDLLVKYLLCTICLFLWHTRKDHVCNGKQSDTVLCYIFRSSCSLNQYGEWYVTMVLMFFLCISDFTDNKMQMWVILFIDYSCIFVSFCMSIFILSVSTYSVINMSLSTLEQFLWGLLYTVLLYICISY